MTVISSFTGEHAFLSNYWVGEPIAFTKYEALSGEHLFQAMKCRDSAHFIKILACATPGEAKAEGRHLLRLRPDWERVKLDVMRLVLGLKFTLRRAEGSSLLETEDALLVEGTPWSNKTWGVAISAGSTWVDAPGRNWLGALLMARRAELQVEATDGEAPHFDYTSTLDFIRYRPATEDR